eukprot:Skav215729  [mRNA]  locus=scaffold1867:76739:78104:- [translate_table: standard]
MSTDCKTVKEQVETDPPAAHLQHGGVAGQHLYEPVAQGALHVGEYADDPGRQVHFRHLVHAAGISSSSSARLHTAPPQYWANATRAAKAISAVMTVRLTEAAAAGGGPDPLVSLSPGQADEE